MLSFLTPITNVLHVDYYYGYGISRLRINVEYQSILKSDKNFVEN